ncbi:MAG: hypothetical protein R3282_05900 [Rhodothermales bacterium]|nr:hypothetical protein [Rhodothermales bacterium]
MYAVVLVLGGCTQIPTKEFTSYKEAFSNARHAGEQVLLDYGTALKEDERDRARRSPAPAANPSEDAPSEFNPAAIGGNGRARDVVAVRMQAWEIVARYNDVLSGLAEGKRAEQLVAVTEGLFESLSSFPIEDVADAAGSFAPFMSVLKTVIAKAAEERSRQDFVMLVEKGDPAIRGTFIALLREDSIRFFEVRKTLNDRAYSRLERDLRDLGADFLTLMQHYEPTEKLRSVTAAAKVALDEFDMGSAMQVNDNGNENFTELAESQLNGLVAAMTDKGAAMKAKRAELIAYHDLLTSYVSLVNQMAAALERLGLAARTTSTQFPPVRDLLNVYIDLRQAFDTYRTAQRSAS